MLKLLNTHWKASVFITVLASFLYIPFIGNIPLFDWDEINFAECAREMLVSNDYSNVQLYFRPFWEKPPLFIWLQALSMNIFGINEFAARFPNALCGVVTLLVLYRTGTVLNDRKFGLSWSLVYASTLLPHLFFKTGIIDPWFNLFIYLSVFYLMKHTNNPVGKFAYQTALLSGFFLGLALLTKGPAAIILVGLTVAVFFILSRFKTLSEPKFIAVFFITFLITGLSWFAVELIKGNGYIIKEFIDYQIRLFKTEDADHGGIFLYHFIVLLIGCFPSSLLLILAHRSSPNDTPFQQHHKRWMLCLFWVVLLVFSIVKTKIVHYSSLCYFPLTYLATYAIQKIISGEFKWKIGLQRAFLMLTLLMGLAFVAVGCIHFFKPWLLSTHVIADSFALENLKAEVHWNGFEWLIGLFFILGIAYSIFQMNHGKLKFIYGIFLTSLITIYSLIMVITPKIEHYSQHASIEFYKMCARHQFDVHTIGFKSYATLFYGEFSPDLKKDPDFHEYAKKKSIELLNAGENPAKCSDLIYAGWVETGNIKRPGCIVTKITDAADVKARSASLKMVYQQNGFVFFVRMPEKKENHSSIKN